MTSTTYNHPNFSAGCPCVPVDDDIAAQEEQTVPCRVEADSIKDKKSGSKRISPLLIWLSQTEPIPGPYQSQPADEKATGFDMFWRNLPWVFSKRSYYFLPFMPPAQNKSAPWLDGSPWLGDLMNNHCGQKFQSWPYQNASTRSRYYAEW